MNKMIVAVFDTEENAYKGVDVLEGFDRNGNIVLYATAVLEKDLDGEVTVRQVAPEGPIGTAVGMLSGAMVGLLGGPIGAAVGTSLGGLTGLLFDVMNAGVNTEFVNDVSLLMLPGMSAVVAEVDEDWVTPVDTKLGELGGFVVRLPRSEVMEVQLACEAEAVSEEMDQLREELKTAGEKNKSTLQDTLKKSRKKLETIVAKANAKLEEIDREAEAKVTALQTRMKTANEERKAKIAKRIVEVKSGANARKEKLRKSRELAKEALTK